MKWKRMIVGLISKTAILLILALGFVTTDAQETRDGSQALDDFRACSQDTDLWKNTSGDVVWLTGRALRKKVKKEVLPFSIHGKGFVTSTLVFVINKSGTVECETWIGGHSLVRSPSLKALRQWKFTPSSVAGEQKATAAKIVFRFRNNNVSFQ